MTGYTLFIDESGEPGISKIRNEETNGASPYMTMGAVLIRNSDYENIKLNLNEFRCRITKSYQLHCPQLDHDQKVAFARFVSTQPIKCFGMMSLKETLGSYKEDINKDHSKYYNKCAQYLLERVGHFLKEKNIKKELVDIVFEERNIDYERLRNFIRTCQKNPQHQNTQLLNYIDADKISYKNKSEESLLELADIVSHSLYKCADGGLLDVKEYRYLHEMKGKFFRCGKTNLVINTGIYAIHSTKQLSLDESVKDFLDSL